jgi:hypothetical protein
VVATFNGFAEANKTATDSRTREQAALLAAQSQEQLRTEPATALDALETAAHKYTVTLNTNVYTISQEAKPLSAGGSTTGCSATEATSVTGANFLITSYVTWPTQERSKRPGVKQSGVITPPTGSDVEVDVTNGVGGGVEGVTARATFVPVESGSYNTVEGTTGAGGCVVLTGLQTTQATIEILEKPGFVTISGALKPTPKVLTIAPSITTHYTVQYAEAGRIAATYTYKGTTSFDGKTVEGDTFVAANAKMNAPPDYEIGSTFFNSCEGSEELSKAATGKYGATAETPACSKYPKGNLFPFSTKWLVYAGDCELNLSSEGETSALVTSGATTTAKVPLDFTDLVLYNGTYGKTTALTEAVGPVRVMNNACASAPTPNNSWGFTYAHEQASTIAKETTAGEGRLKNPFLPFGSNFSLCLIDTKLTSKGVKGKAFSVPFSNVKLSEVAKPTIYLGQKTEAEQEAAEEPSEAKIVTLTPKVTTLETKVTTLETKITTLETAQTNENNAKTSREATEATERSAWKTKKEKNQISQATYEKELATQKSAREAKEATEATNKTKRTGELNTAKSELTTAKNELTTVTNELNAAKTELKGFETTATEEGNSGVTVKAGETC